MTNTEAIKQLQERLDLINRDYYEEAGLKDYANALELGVKALEAQEWIPWNSWKFPEESGTYIVTAYDGAITRVTYAKYQKRLKRWELTGARAYWRVLAWKRLPEPYREDGNEQT